MARARTLPPRDQIADNAPLRLDIAAALAFPDGSMTASGLRREAGRGRLAIERVAGKDYTTLGAIHEMRQRCRVEARDRASGCVEHNMIAMAASPMPPSGSSKTANIERARDAALTIVEGLRRRSRPTSPSSISTKRKPACVHQVASRSPTS
jgi:hypothetical protein